MFYRRKILLALTEVFGGKLKRTELQKLLFLYCQETQNSHYDFFPYKYGSFSFLVRQDKYVLTKLGFLGNQNDYELCSNQSFLDKVNEKEKRNLKSFASRYKNFKGNTLVRYVYLKYPHYTCQSQVIEKILTPDEIAQVSNWWNLDKTQCLFTLGYEGLSIDAYLNKLILNNIKLLVDVRKNPISMKYGFSKTKFRSYLENARIKYVHIPEFGIPSNLRQDLDSPEAYEKLFKYYSSEILPKQLEAIKKLKILINKYKRVVLTCFEKEHYKCHRHKISEHLVKSHNSNFKTVHL